jgi:Rrf2 family protein
MLTKATEYAIRALVYIELKNSEGKRPGFKEIAKEIDSPESFTAKILQILTRQGIIGSMKGRGGGFFFETEDRNLSIYSVIVAVEGKKFFDKCGFGLKNCNASNPCPFHDEYKQIRDDFTHLVQSKTIQSFAAKVKKGDAVLNRMPVR